MPRDNGLGSTYGSVGGVKNPKKKKNRQNTPVAIAPTFALVYSGRVKYVATNPMTTKENTPPRPIKGSIRPKMKLISIAISILNLYI